MESTGFLQFFSQVYTKNVRYCVICLRTESEVNLTLPLAFRKILGALKFAEHVFHNYLLCNICGAKAAAAAKFVDKVHVAFDIQKIFKTVKESRGWEKTNQKMLQNLMMSQPEFSEIQMRNQYVFTDVLIIDNMCEETSEHGSPPNTLPASQLVGETSLHNSLTHTELLKQTSSNTMLPVETVIIDDDDPKEANIPKLKLDDDNVSVVTQLDLSPNHVTQPPTDLSNLNKESVATGRDRLLCATPKPSSTSQKSRKRLQPTTKKVNNKRKGVTDDELNPRIASVKSEKAGEGDDDNDVVLITLDDEIKEETEIIKRTILKDSKINLDKYSMDPITIVGKNQHQSSLQEATRDLLKDLRDFID